MKIKHSIGLALTSLIVTACGTGGSSDSTVVSANPAPDASTSAATSPTQAAATSISSSAGATPNAAPAPVTSPVSIALPAPAPELASINSSAAYAATDWPVAEVMRKFANTGCPSSFAERPPHDGLFTITPLTTPVLGGRDPTTIPGCESLNRLTSFARNGISLWSFMWSDLNDGHGIRFDYISVPLQTPCYVRWGGEAVLMPATMKIGSSVRWACGNRRITATGIESYEQQIPAKYWVTWVDRSTRAGYANVCMAFSDNPSGGVCARSDANVNLDPTTIAWVMQ